jgi:Pyruvate/2-oxoacid:ferredoxin oxidoreductase delta subunit
VSNKNVCKPPGGAHTPPPAGGSYQGPQAGAEAARCLATVDCTFCQVCELMCPDLCITRDPGTGDILIDLNHCKGCGLCAHFCPKGAIRMELEPSG